MTIWPFAKPATDEVVHVSTYENIYHCTVQKSASQWVRGILSHPLVYRYSGLRPFQYQSRLPVGHDPRPLTQRRFQTQFPMSTIATPMYVDCAGFESIPKPANYRAFFVMRDPRDIVVSWYFSAKFSHPTVGTLEQVRGDLLRFSEAEGLCYAIEYLDEFGLYEAQRSWGESACSDELMRIRYEDLFSADQKSIVEALFRHCDIRMPANRLDELLAGFSFENVSGRRRGDEDVHAHYRKGVAGDWRNHFTKDVQGRFATVAGDVLAAWGYD